ncbi:MAG: type III pantothenate kinase [Firmicutes bacterium]|nr:type III pantothenate kinase [Bacillota bacterium]MCM1400699.1 type III pantothenate kinase [Bacteroides sp.]MCM1476393.1 type III pantothenate kinase [Bacteroides sp.]
MSINLTIDQGNSAAKLALWKGETMVDSRIETSLTPDAIHHFLHPHTPKVDNAIYCSVVSRGTEVMAMLSEFASRAMRLSSDMPLPITIDYGTPGTLGADRVAAGAGAAALFPGERLLVVDAGTAVTYDAISENGHFLGGNIAPGMNMRLEALHRFTARLPRVKVPRELPTDRIFGCDTASAMILGSVYGILGAISYYESQFNPSRVVMTGGWAGELSRLCQFPVHVEPQLVSIGLNRILIYNETK